MSLSEVQLHLVDDLQTAQEMMTWLGERHDGGIAFDVESEGLDTIRHKVRMVQLGDSRHGWAVPWEGWGGVFLEAMRKYDGRLIAHNAKFDVAMLRNHCGWNAPQHRVDDTRLMAHVIEPIYSTALKKLCARHVDPASAALQNQLDSSLASGKNEQGWTWATIPIDYQPYWAYAACDTVLTARLAEILRQQVADAGAQRAYDLELAASWVCMNMESHGIAVDRPYTAQAFNQFHTYAKSLSDWCEQNYGVRPGQNASVADALIAEGVPLDRATASGAIQMDKSVLGDIDHPLAQTVLKHRQYTKLANTYLKNYIDGTSEDDPYLHPSINTVGARTGRMSISGPALQTLPRRSEERPDAITVRNCIVPSEGNTLLMIDFSQIELRVLAHLANDTALQEAFKGDDDFFTRLARDIYQVPDMNKKDDRRATTKNAMYARVYGAGSAKFAATAGITQEQGQGIYDRIATLYPGTVQMPQMVQNVARQRLQDEGSAYVKSPLTGRVHPADEDGTFKLVNYLIQGMAAEIFKTKLIGLSHAGLDEFMCLPVHDEVVFDVPQDQLQEVAQIALSVMNDNTMLSVPIEAEASVGERWGSKRDL